MFRNIVRKKQQLSQEECIAILKQEPRGVLSVQGDDGYPYGMPINYWYNDADGHLYFHGAMKGHKVDAIKRNDKVSLCVYDQGYRREGEWSLNIKSVIIFGRMRIVDDKEKALEMIRSFAYKYTDDSEYIEREIRTAGNHVLCMELVPEFITGKITNES